MQFLLSWATGFKYVLFYVWFHKAITDGTKRKPQKAKTVHLSKKDFLIGRKFQTSLRLTNPDYFTVT
jgi:hypothetical protein